MLPLTELTKAKRGQFRSLATRADACHHLLGFTIQGGSLTASQFPFSECVVGPPRGKKIETGRWGRRCTPPSTLQYTPGFRSRRIGPGGAVGQRRWKVLRMRAERGGRNGSGVGRLAGAGASSAQFAGRSERKSAGEHAFSIRNTGAFRAHIASSSIERLRRPPLLEGPHRSPWNRRMGDSGLPNLLQRRAVVFPLPLVGGFEQVGPQASCEITPPEAVGPAPSRVACALSTV